MSIKDAAKDLFGWGGFMSWVVDLEKGTTLAAYIKPGRAT